MARNEKKIRAPRGMPDILPDQMPLVRHIEQTAHSVFARYGYEEIRTPLFEETRLFIRGIGEATDIVEKEMYTFGPPDQVWVALTHLPSGFEQYEGLHVASWISDDEWGPHDSNIDFSIHYVKDKNLWNVRLFDPLHEGSPLLEWECTPGGTSISSEGAWCAVSEYREVAAGITLRPEATAPVVRSVIENDLLKKKGFWKLYYVGPMFRKERPQAGRMRQFSQIGVEAIGSSEPAVDAETICLAARFFEAIGLEGVKVKLNTIGCPECRAQYRRALRAALEPRRSELCEDCQARFDRNIFRVLDCKKPNCKAIALEAPVMREHLDADCRAHFEQVTSHLSAAGQEFEVDDHLVRGFDYYTRTVFELTHSALGARDAICGGGRYDNLVEELGGPKAGCAGFAVGVVPTILALQKTSGQSDIKAPRPVVYIAAVDDTTRAECFRIAQELRRAGISAELDHERRSLKAQMRSANRCKAQHVIVLGPDELANGTVTLKDMDSRIEEKLALDAVISRLAQKG